MFVDSQSRVDREGLRTYIVGQLTQMKAEAEKVCVDRAAFWNKALVSARAQLFGTEQTKAVTTIRQLSSLPQFIQTWSDTAVESPERFDFFVLAKAHELKSGDQQKDYFWALQIRHDQLVALVRVLDMLLDKMKLWVSLKPHQLFDDPVFAGLTEYGLEDQVYLEAEKVYKERQQLTGVYD